MQAIIALLEARCYRDAQKAAREITLVAHTDKQPHVYREEMVPGALGGADPVGELLKTVSNVGELKPDDFLESVASHASCILPLGVLFFLAAATSVFC